MKHKIYVVGIGPGTEELMTRQAVRILEESEVIVGYSVYLELLGGKFRNKELLSTPMKKEVERCHMAYQKAMEGKSVSLICSGDAGIYGMASLMYELLPEYPDCELTVIPGITAANSGASLLGAPLNNDFCVISLSDLLTPWEEIEKRLKKAAEADFAIVLYNPSSHKRFDYLQKACDVLLEDIEESRVCGTVENIGRDGTKVELCSLKELRFRQVNMFTTVFIGSSQSVLIDGKMITKRGYKR